MPNAQVVTEGFPLHALGLNSSLHMSLHTADIETYSLQQKISVLFDNPKTACHVRFCQYYNKSLEV